MWCKTKVHLFSHKPCNLSSYLDICGFPLYDAIPQDGSAQRAVLILKVGLQGGEKWHQFKIREGNSVPTFNFAN